MPAPRADVAVDDAIVTRLVAEQLPALASSPVSHLATGWDHAVFHVGHQWLVRLPLRADRVAWLEREVAVLARVEASLGGLVPRIELVGVPSATFPYPFLAYRRLPGDPVAGAPRRGLAADLGSFLGRLHGVDAGGLPPTPERWELEDDAAGAALRALGAPRRDRVLACLAPALRADAAPYLEGRRAAPPTPATSRCLTHDDLCASHVLVDEHGRLSGVVDFTDAMVADPVVDFAGLCLIGDGGFLAEVLAAYPRPLGDGFFERLAHAARTAALHWLDEALEDGEAPGPHVEVVVRAFAIRDDPWASGA